MRRFVKRVAVAPDVGIAEIVDEEVPDVLAGCTLYALDMGGLESPEMIHLLAGICAYRAGMNEEARVWLNRAKESREHRAQAEMILRRMREGRT